MPSDNIERAIRRVAEKDTAALAEVTVEAIGPGGAAVVIHAITDNSNRTINELKQLMGKMGARMVPPGSLAWVLKTPLEIREAPQKEQLQALIQALDAHDDVQKVLTNAEQ
jgi:transcriptional/translational regulatory protein YebC/TACO1